MDLLLLLLLILLQLDCLLFPPLLAILPLQRRFLLLLLECPVAGHALMHFVSDLVGFWPLHLGPFRLHSFRFHCSGHRDCHHYRHRHHRMVCMVHHRSLCLRIVRCHCLLLQSSLLGNCVNECDNGGCNW